MMPVRKKVLELLIIILGAAYLLYRFFAPKVDMRPADDMVGGMQIKMAKFKEITKKAQLTDKDAKNSGEKVRDIFQKPDELAGSGQYDAVLAGAQNNALSLEGTIWGQKKNIAIISGKVVVEGDKINGERIVRIEPGRAVILKNGIETEIKRGKPNE